MGELSEKNHESACEAAIGSASVPTPDDECDSLESDPAQNDHDASDAKGAACGAARSGALFFGLAAVWVIFDFMTKQFFKDGVVGHRYLDPVLGLFDFRLVHNTGGAWGVFSDSTLALAVFSLVICAVIAVFFVVERRALSTLAVVGLSLIFAGGIGNAIDRFAQGYVVDFIEFTFIDFPVFNVADIGVTCGFAILFISLAIDYLNDGEGGR